MSSIVTSRQIPLYQMMSYHMGWNDARGETDMHASRERIHGVLCLLASRAAGGDLDTAIPTAAAVELVHNFCEIHDDVQGGNPQRNNRDAVWWVWGPAQAINAGDGMHALARLALFRLLERGVSKVTTFHAIRVLDEASLRACEGRYMDLEAQERIDMSMDSYLKMASGKTGALVGCAMKLGAVVASNDGPVAQAMETCGTRLGVAMQMRADIRELWNGSGEDTTPSLEVMNKKKLLPVVYSLEKASATEKRKLGEIYFRRVLEPSDVSRVREVIEQMGTREECESLVARYRAESLVALDVPGVSGEGKADIERFADRLLQ